ncbi:hypothetical protein F5890DRAFT_923618 [Lentinula detonsa]|uniref:Uncharacterized protein n=1 Tax=Lentinula detonsa TaxID=2804962 RepID=A0AA38UVU3_9AGAR|nr:hypothetical protein F5890DRAFT_923618 [Lentinula detonsa]
MTFTISPACSYLLNYSNHCIINHLVYFLSHLIIRCMSFPPYFFTFTRVEIRETVYGISFTLYLACTYHCNLVYISVVNLYPAPIDTYMILSTD